MIIVTYSTLEGRDEKVFIELDQSYLNIKVNEETKPILETTIKRFLKQQIEDAEIEYRLDPFVKHLEQSGNHINEETGKPYLEEEKDSEEDGLIEEDNIQLDLEDERDE